MISFSQSIQQVFQNHADPELAKPMQAYMKNLYTFYGLKSPLRRTLMKQTMSLYPKDLLLHVNDIARDLYKDHHRELHYVAIECVDKAQKYWNIHTIELLEYMITTHSWWDSVDSIAPLVGLYFQKFPEQRMTFITKWMASKNMWLQRICILHQKRYKAQTDQQLLFSLCIQLKESKEFFIRKAIGWALREYSYVHPHSVISFVHSHEFSGLTKREALKHLKSDII